MGSTTSVEISNAPKNDTVTNPMQDALNLRRDLNTLEMSNELPRVSDWIAILCRNAAKRGAKYISVYSTQITTTELIGLLDADFAILRRKITPLITQYQLHWNLPEQEARPFHLVDEPAISSIEYEEFIDMDLREDAFFSTIDSHLAGIDKPSAISAIRSAVALYTRGFSCDGDNQRVACLGLAVYFKKRPSLTWDVKHALHLIIHTKSTTGINPEPSQCVPM